MADRIILHADCNNFFASCECLERPELREVPMAVAGDPDRRVGIVVAKNEAAKRFGVRTTDTVWQARMKCPDIVFVPPRHRYYAEISRRVNSIYRQYTDLVEPASIDESFLDVTGRNGSPAALADELRARVRGEIGITISVGVSFCKVFAKMGSDYKKPDATTVIGRDDFKRILWPLPVGELPFAGRSTVERLERAGVRTVGDLARLDPDTARSLLGRQGIFLRDHANGVDPDPVRRFDDEREIKSVSRGRTFPRDITGEEELMPRLNALSGEVAACLRREGLKGSVISVQVRRPELTWLSRQTKLAVPTRLQHEIRDTALELIRKHRLLERPVRALTVGVGGIVPAEAETEQISLFDLEPDARSARRDRLERLESVVDVLQRRIGKRAVTLGIQTEVFEDEEDD